MIKLILISSILFSFFIQTNAQDSVRAALIEHKQQLFQNALLTPQSAELIAAQKQIDALYYAIHIKVDYQTPKLEGRVSARFQALADNLQQVWLDLERAMNVDSVSAAAISAVHNQDVIEIELDKTYSFGEEFTVTIYYSGAPATGGMGYFQFDQMPDGSSHVWTLSEPYGAKYWWPCKDTPADKADSADIYITIPDDQLAGSNGTLISVTDNGDGTQTFHWSERYPIATYLVSLAIGNYEHFQEYYKYSDTDSMLLDYYVYPGQKLAAQNAFSGMHDYLNALSYYFGPYPFLKEKYGMAQFNRGGRMEHQTLTSIGRIGSGWTYLYVHELAHQWFGDAVTCASWTDIWLNEGFASYSEALYAEWAGYNNHPPGFEAYQAYMMSQYYVEGGTIFITDTSSVSNIFNKIVYDKGSWVLHMLRHILGDKIFFDVLKSYVYDLRWQYGSVRTDNFKTVCEEKSGLDLNTFFGQWLHYPFFPKYSYSWQDEDLGDGTFSLNVSILQNQNSVIYQMPIDVLIEMENGTDTTFIVQNDRRNQLVHFNLPAKPQQVSLDPDNWILKDIYFNQTQYNLSKIEFEKIYPNPFYKEVTIQLVNWSGNPVRLGIYDVQGRIVKTLQTLDIVKPDYIYIWDGRNEWGVRVSSGIYFIRSVNQKSGLFGSRKIVMIH